MGIPEEDRPKPVRQPVDGAGPLERRLYHAVLASVGDLSVAKWRWERERDVLIELAKTLEDQADELELAYGSSETSTGYAAASAYRELATIVKAREAEMTNVAGGLTKASDAVTTARLTYDALGPALGPKGSELVATATPTERTDAETARQGQISQREAAAKAALSTLDADYQKAAEKMGAPRADTVPESGGSAPARPVTTGHGPTGGIRPPGVIGTPPPVSILPPEIEEPHPPVGPVIEHPGLVVTTPEETGNGGLSGVDPTVSTGTPGNHGTGSTAGGGMGAASALGAGAISGAGAVMGSRGGGLPRTIGAGSTGQIGKSSTSTSRGALGRAGVAPGQSGQPGTRAGKPGGRGAVRAVPGSATGQSTGRAGGRGGKGPLAAGGTGGRTGKRGENGEEGLEHFEYDDSQSWLDDDASSKPVID